MIIGRKYVRGGCEVCGTMVVVGWRDRASEWYSSVRLCFECECQLESECERQLEVDSNPKLSAEKQERERDSTMRVMPVSGARLVGRLLGGLVR